MIPPSTTAKHSNNWQIHTKTQGKVYNTNNEMYKEIIAVTDYNDMRETVEDVSIL